MENDRHQTKGGGRVSPSPYASRRSIGMTLEILHRLTQLLIGVFGNSVHAVGRQAADRGAADCFVIP